MKTNTVTKLLNALKLFSLAVILAMGLSYALVWAAPTATPPAGNISAPITTSATIPPQVKLGSLTIGTAVTPAPLTVIGNINVTGNVCTVVGTTTICLGSLTSEPRGLIIRAIHTFRDCITAGGTVREIGEAKYICRLPSLISGWTQYQNWTTTQNVYGDGFVQAPEGWNYIITQTGCNTGSHAFSDTPTESCTGSTYGKECWYKNGILKCWYPTYYVTYYATVTERGGY